MNSWIFSSYILDVVDFGDLFILNTWSMSQNHKITKSQNHKIYKITKSQNHWIKESQNHRIKYKVSYIPLHTPLNVPLPLPPHPPLSPSCQTRSSRRRLFNDNLLGSAMFFVRLTWHLFLRLFPALSPFYANPPSSGSSPLFLLLLPLLLTSGFHASSAAPSSPSSSLADLNDVNDEADLPFLASPQGTDHWYIGTLVHW